MRRHVGNLLFDLPFEALKRPGALSELGCSTSGMAAFVKSADTIADSRPVMAIEQWQWLEFRYARKELAEYERIGLKPIYLWSPRVVIDGTGRWRVGDWVLTSELKQLHDNCIFETKSTVYVMAGHGMRKIIRS